MKEIELKAHVLNVPQTEAKIAAFAELSGTVDKSDTYWYNPKLPLEAQTVRVREQKSRAPDGGENTQTLVTCKRKEMLDGIEVNDETEFTVSDKTAFEVFLHDADYSIVRTKVKKVTSWHYEDVHIELCTLAGLGNFIEIEIVSDRDTVQIDVCRKKLLRVLARCGVDKVHIEPAYYSQLMEANCNV